jgi:hypothetical protein
MGKILQFKPKDITVDDETEDVKEAIKGLRKSFSDRQIAQIVRELEQEIGDAC